MSYNIRQHDTGWFERIMKSTLGLPQEILLRTAYALKGERPFIGKGGVIDWATIPGFAFFGDHSYGIGEKEYTEMGQWVGKKLDVKSLKEGGFAAELTGAILTDPLAFATGTMGASAKAATSFNKMKNSSVALSRHLDSLGPLSTKQSLKAVDDILAKGEIPGLKAHLPAKGEGVAEVVKEGTEAATKLEGKDLNKLIKAREKLDENLRSLGSKGDMKKALSSTAQELAEWGKGDVSVFAPLLGFFPGTVGVKLPFKGGWSEITTKPIRKTVGATLAVPAWGLHQAGVAVGMAHSGLGNVLDSVASVLRAPLDMVNGSKTAGQDRLLLGYSLAKVFEGLPDGEKLAAKASKKLEEMRKADMGLASDQKAKNKMVEDLDNALNVEDELIALNSPLQEAISKLEREATALGGEHALVKDRQLALKKLRQRSNLIQTHLDDVRQQDGFQTTAKADRHLDGEIKRSNAAIKALEADIEDVNRKGLIGAGPPPREVLEQRQKDLSETLETFDAGVVDKRAELDLIDAKGVKRRDETIDAIHAEIETAVNNNAFKGQTKVGLDRRLGNATRKEATAYLSVPERTRRRTLTRGIDNTKREARELADSVNLPLEVDELTKANDKALAKIVRAEEKIPGLKGHEKKAAKAELKAAKEAQKDIGDRLELAEHYKGKDSVVRDPKAVQAKNATITALKTEITKTRETLKRVRGKNAIRESRGQPLTDTSELVTRLRILTSRRDAEFNSLRNTARSIRDSAKPKPSSVDSIGMAKMEANLRGLKNQRRQFLGDKAHNKALAEGSDRYADIKKLVADSRAKGRSAVGATMLETTAETRNWDSWLAKELGLENIDELKEGALWSGGMKLADVLDIFKTKSGSMKSFTRPGSSAKIGYEDIRAFTDSLVTGQNNVSMIDGGKVITAELSEAVEAVYKGGKTSADRVRQFSFELGHSMGNGFQKLFGGKVKQKQIAEYYRKHNAIFGAFSRGLEQKGAQIGHILRPLAKSMDMEAPELSENLGLLFQIMPSRFDLDNMRNGLMKFHNNRGSVKDVGYLAHSLSEYMDRLLDTRKAIMANDSVFAPALNDAYSKLGLVTDGGLIKKTEGITHTFESKSVLRSLDDNIKTLQDVLEGSTSRTDVMARTSGLTQQIQRDMELIHDGFLDAFRSKLIDESGMKEFDKLNKIWSDLAHVGADFAKARGTLGDFGRIAYLPRTLSQEHSDKLLALIGEIGAESAGAHALLKPLRSARARKFDRISVQSLNDLVEQLHALGRRGEISEGSKSVTDLTDWLDANLPEYRSSKHKFETDPFSARMVSLSAQESYSNAAQLIDETSALALDVLKNGGKLGGADTAGLVVAGELLGVFDTSNPAVIETITSGGRISGLDALERSVAERVGGSGLKYPATPAMPDEFNAEFLARDGTVTPYEDYVSKEAFTDRGQAKRNESLLSEADYVASQSEDKLTRANQEWENKFQADYRDSVILDSKLDPSADLSEVAQELTLPPEYKVVDDVEVSGLSNLDRVGRTVRLNHAEINSSYDELISSWINKSNMAHTKVIEDKYAAMLGEDINLEHFVSWVHSNGGRAKFTEIIARRSMGRLHVEDTIKGLDNYAGLDSMKYQNVANPRAAALNIAFKESGYDPASGFDMSDIVKSRFLQGAKNKEFLSDRVMAIRTADGNVVYQSITGFDEGLSASFLGYGPTPGKAAANSLGKPNGTTGVIHPEVDKESIAELLGKGEPPQVMLGTKSAVQGTLALLEQDQKLAGPGLRAFDGVHRVLKMGVTTMHSQFHINNMLSTIPLLLNEGATARALMGGAADMAMFVFRKHGFEDDYNLISSFSGGSGLLANPAARVGMGAAAGGFIGSQTDEGRSIGAGAAMGAAMGAGFAAAPFQKFRRAAEAMAFDARAGAQWGDAVIKIGKTEYSVAELMATYAREGGFNTFQGLSDVSTTNTMIKDLLHNDPDIAKRGMDALSEMGQSSEITSRLTGYFTFLRMGYDPATAAKKTIHAMADYNDRTWFEQNIAGRYSSFFTFARKKVPDLFHGMAEKPGGMAKLSHSILALDDVDNDGTDLYVSEKQGRMNVHLRGLELSLSRGLFPQLDVLAAAAHSLDFLTPDYIKPLDTMSSTGEQGELWGAMDQGMMGDMVGNMKESGLWGSFYEAIDVSIIGETIGWFTGTEDDQVPTELDTFREHSFRSLGGKRGGSERQIKYMQGKFRRVSMQVDEVLAETTDEKKRAALIMYRDKVKARTDEDVRKMRSQMFYSQK